MPEKIDIPEARFRELWEQNVRTSEMAAEFGCSTGTISNRAKKLNLPRRSCGRKPDPNNEFSKFDPPPLEGGRWVYDPRRCVKVWVEDS